MIHDDFSYNTRWRITRYADEQAFAQNRPSPVTDAGGKELPAEGIIEGNLLLNEGIGELLDLLCGLGSPTNFGTSNARIAVGDSTTAENATQTGLQAATNKTYKAIEAGYPTRSNQTATWRAIFGADDANHAWKEFSVANGSSDTAKNLNRKVSEQGVKVNGQVWSCDLEITIS